MDVYTERPNGYTLEAKDRPLAASNHGTLRVPTVDEALPYTPFSSIIPFDPGTSLSKFTMILATSRSGPLTHPLFLSENHRLT